MFRNSIFTLAISSLGYAGQISLWASFKNPAYKAISKKSDAIPTASVKPKEYKTKCKPLKSRE